MVRVVISKTRQYGWHIYIHCSAECIHRNHLVHKYWITPPKCNCTSFPQSSFFFSIYLLFRSGPPSGNLKTPEPHLETGKLFLHRWSSVQQERLNVFVVCFLNEPRSRNCWWRCGAEIVTTESLHLSLSLSSTEPSDSPDKLKAKVHEVWQLYITLTLCFACFCQSRLFARPTVYTYTHIL